MCLVGMRFEPDRSRLQIAANRDEFHQRPAQAAGWWADEPTVYGGRDLEAGGTWLAVDRGGRMAAVTNVRKPGAQVAGAQSRGDLPLAFLRGDQSAEAFTRSLDGRAYGPFNLLLFDGRSLWWTSNQAGPARAVGSGITGLSNAALDTPWPKVAALKNAMAASSDAEPLFEVLARREIPPGTLPDTGVGLELERLLAPSFIVSDRYGTRCSTVLTITPAGVVFEERLFGPSGLETKRGQTTFSTEKVV
ncbi:MAG: NRDE family protein [Pseudomonadota bacterium]